MYFQNPNALLKYFSDDITIKIFLHEILELLNVNYQNIEFSFLIIRK